MTRKWFRLMCLAGVLATAPPALAQDDADNSAKVPEKILSLAEKKRLAVLRFCADEANKETVTCVEFAKTARTAPRR
ncbi:hypothetical protein [Actibacterium lipolyticum]|uniref:Uncharacterized protein n=1 Tax=Actibacterium lipolyticum TaxID=1524263 RepID=A0A238JQG9_9RHOB|nr:hypothetical protein [Actibacterium lipolyticum]SMX32928.1 hypothetical protein COL8621_00921 [Actibacterium lipolyticum]